MKKSSVKYYVENGVLKKATDFVEDKEGQIIYEVIRIIDGKPLFMEQHFKRMQYSFNLINVDCKFEFEDILKQIKTLVKESKILEGNIKITYSVNNDILKIYYLKHKYPSKKDYEEGVDTILFFGERNNPNAKIVDNNFRQKVNKEIEDRGVYEAILVNNNGVITEGSKSNIFMIKDDVIYTSRVEDVLPGVTRNEIISLAIKMNIKISEENIGYLGVKDMDAMFISGTSPKILPIRKVEGKELDVKNDLLRKLMIEFDKKIEKDIKSQK